jgi:hypothetical protein
MRYYPLDFMPEFWKDVELMIEEHYATDEDAIVLLGTYLKWEVTDIRQNNPGVKLIIFQTEPLSPNHWWTEAHIMRKINDADEVWETNWDNYQKLLKLGINVRYTPFRYTEALKRIKTLDKPDIDVLFYGTITNYRMRILEQLQDLAYNMVIVFGIAGPQLDEYIARSKIILNLNSEREAINQKEARIFYLLTNDKCVISQKSSSNVFGDLIIETDDLVNTICEYLSYNKWKGFSQDLSERYKQMAY